MRCVFVISLPNRHFDVAEMPIFKMFVYSRLTVSRLFSGAEAVVETDLKPGSKLPACLPASLLGNYFSHVREGHAKCP